MGDMKEALTQALRNVQGQRLGFQKRLNKPVQVYKPKPLPGRDKDGSKKQ